MTESDIIAAIATAPGRGGIGVVRVSGPRLEPFMRPAMLRPTADQEVGIGADAAVGQVIVGKDDQNIRPGVLEALADGLVAARENLPVFRRRLVEETHLGGCMRHTRGKHDFRHPIAPLTFDPVSGAHE